MCNDPSVFTFLIKFIQKTTNLCIVLSLEHVRDISKIMALDMSNIKETQRGKYNTLWLSIRGQRRSKIDLYIY